MVDGRSVDDEDWKVVGFVGKGEGMNEWGIVCVCVCVCVCKRERGLKEEKAGWMEVLYHCRI